MILNRVLSITIAMLCSISLAMLYSANFGDVYPWFYRQSLFLACFVPAVYLVVNIETKYIVKHLHWLYVIPLVLLIITYLSGHKAMGAQRWLRLGGMSIQPGEIVKIGVVHMIALVYHKMRMYSDIVREIISVFLVAIPIVFILLQPNFSTAFIILLSTGCMILVAGLSIRKIVVMLIAVLVLIPTIYANLHDYQKQRIVGFLDPYSDPRGRGYNLIQSEIAISGGGKYGVGITNSEQNKLHFLPEKQTDFIFSLFAEEFGFVGVMLVLLLYITLFICILIIILRVESIYAKLVCTGLGTIIFLHTALNLSMISGLIPIVGTPLPFISYGGSNLLFSLLSCGIILNLNSKKEIN